MSRVEHGFRWWPTVKAGRSVCACGDFYPCIRMKSVIQSWRPTDDEGRLTPYADEMLAEFSQHGIEPEGRLPR